MNKKEIAEINKYCTPDSILIVTKSRKLIRLFCPFQVKTIRDIGKIKKSDIATVTKIKITQTLQLVYVIEGDNYLYSNFIILYDAEK
jgi:hypothetical protein